MSQHTKLVLIISIVVLINVVTFGVAIEFIGRGLRCEWCRMPYAYWKRGGSRCCWKHRKEGKRLAALARARLRPTTPHKNGRSTRYSIPTPEQIVARSASAVE